MRPRGSYVTRTRRLTLLTIASPLLAGCASPDGERMESGAERSVNRVSFPVSCESAVQADFDRGVAYLHSFEWELAIRHFERVADSDADCAMAWWGIAAAHGPIAWGEAFVAAEPGLAALAEARRIGGLTAREQAYVDALALLYEDFETRPFADRLRLYSGALDALRSRYPDDLEAALLYALSLIATVDPSDTTHAVQRKAGEIAEAVFRQVPHHPGAAHYIIHAYDYPGLARLALPAARTYADIAPAAMHARHMPSHIFSRLGLWEETIQANLRVLAAAPPDHADVAHALDYLVYAHLQRGDDERAASRYSQLLEHARAHAGVYVADEHLADILARYPLERRDFSRAAGLELPARWEAEPRFAATILFAQAWGAARSGDAEAASEAAALLPGLIERLRRQGATYYAASVVVWAQVANGWLAHARGEHDRAVALLRQAATADDATAYVGSFESSADALVHPREELGDLLLAMDRPAEALAAFSRSLTVSPGRFNAIHGAARAARLAGDSTTAREWYEQLLSIAAPSSEREALEEARGFLRGEGGGQASPARPTRPRRAPRASRATTPAFLVVGGRQAGGQAFVHGVDIRAAVRIDERDRDSHLAAQGGVRRLELDDLHDPLVLLELHEAAVVRVGMRGRLAGSGRLVIRERDSERAALTGLQSVHPAGHAGRHSPPRDGTGIEERAVHGRAGGVDVSGDTSRGHRAW